MQLVMKAISMDQKEDFFFFKCDNVTAIVTEHQEEENLGDLCC